jgi:hypothetical protein
MYYSDINFPSSKNIKSKIWASLRGKILHCVEWNSLTHQAPWAQFAVPQLRNTDLYRFSKNSDWRNVGLKDWLICDMGQ